MVLIILTKLAWGAAFFISFMGTVSLGVLAVGTNDWRCGLVCVAFYVAFVAVICNMPISL